MSRCLKVSDRPRADPVNTDRAPESGHHKHISEPFKPNEVVASRQIPLPWPTVFPTKWACHDPHHRLRSDRVAHQKEFRKAGTSGPCPRILQMDPPVRQHRMRQ